MPLLLPPKFKYDFEGLRQGIQDGSNIDLCIDKQVVNILNFELESK